MTVPATEPVRIWHLLTHTAGLTYGFHRAHPVDAMYRAAGFELAAPPGMDLAQACDPGRLPLLFQPGTEWNYSVATDVLGRVVEVASGQRLDEFFAGRIFGPLGMTDTGFWVDAARPAAAGRPLHARGRPGRRAGWTPSARTRAARRGCSAAAAVWSPPLPTTTGSPRCCCTGPAARRANWTARGC